MELNGLNPEDFKRLPKDGAQFEALVCHLLEAMGFRILEKPAVGTEGGRDVLVERTLKDGMGEKKERVVIQCKHHAHSGKAVGDSDVGVWVNTMTRYKARGYLLVTDTRITENLSRSFREYSNDDSNFLNWANFWDVDELILRLNEHPSVRDSFFPPPPIVRTPLESLADEISIWLSAIRYDVSAPHSSNPNSLSMIATFNQGTIKQQVLIRCKGGEIKPSDVDELSNTLDINTPQGWLISDRRVSKRARKRTAEVGTVQVFNLSDLLQQKIWGPYFEQLVSLVEGESINARYVDVRCCTIETDSRGQETARDRYESLDSYVDEWLNERGRVHISLLGDFGAGKTWFCRHYAFRQLQRFLSNPAKERLPLLITLRMFSKAMTAQQLINYILLEHYKLPFVGSAYEVFQEMNRRGKLLLILDGFDEMARKVDYQTVVDNFWQLAKLVEDEGKIILTSRKEYFRWAKESEKILGGEEFGRDTLVLSPPKFEVLYLEPLTNDQIREVIERRLGAEAGLPTAEQILKSSTLAAMAQKPLMIELLLAALEEVNVDILRNQAYVFLYATNRLLLRNIAAEKTFTSTADKLYFLCELAWESIITGEMRIHYTTFPERIGAYFGGRIKDKHDLDTWDYDLRNQTLLHRDAAGYYEFAHKSLAEYFAAFKLAAELDCLDERFKIAYCEAGGTPCHLPYSFNGIDKLLSTFGAICINKKMDTIRGFLFQMMSEGAVPKLWSYLSQLRGRAREQVKYVGSNVVMLLNALGEKFKEKNLSNLWLPEVHLVNIDLARANLSNTFFENGELWRADFSSINCMNVSFRKTEIRHPYLSNAQFESADFTDTSVEWVDYLYTLSFSPDGSQIACGGDDKQIQIYNIGTGEVITTLPGHTTSVQTVAFNPEGDKLATGGGDGYIRVWYVENCQKCWEVKTNSKFIRELTISPSGKWLAGVADDSSIRIFDIDSGMRLHSLKGPDGLISLSFSPNGKFLAAGSRNGFLAVLDIESMTWVKQWQAYERSVHTVAFSSDSSKLISIGIDYSPAKTRRQKHAAPKTINKGKQKGNEVSVIKTWEMPTWRVTTSSGALYYGGWLRGSVSPEGTFITSKDGGIEMNNEVATIWDYQTGKKILTLDTDQGPLFSIKFSPCGKYIATCGGDGTIRIWNSQSGQYVKCLRLKKYCSGAIFKNITGMSPKLRRRLIERGALVVEYPSS